MTEFVTIDENNNRLIKISDLNLKEEIKMSVLNVAMNIGYLNIKISIKKDKKIKKDEFIRQFENQEKMNRSIEDSKDLLFMNNTHNILM